jgi:hypothetical protein
MTRSIVLGGIVGIAVGSVVTFAIAHGVVARTEAGPMPPPPAPIVSPRSLEHAPSDAAVSVHRPLRPGSRSLGAHARLSQS